MSNKPDEIESIPDLDLSGGIRGKYYERYMHGTNLVLLDPDIAAKFTDTVTINQALRAYLTEHSERSGVVTDQSRSEKAVEGGGQFVWQLELTQPFLDSLKHLPDSAGIGSAVARVLEDIVKNPQAARVVAGTRVQIVITREESIAGERVPALQVLYVLGHATNRIKMLSVEIAQPSLRVPENISSRLRTFFPQLNVPRSDHKAG